MHISSAAKISALVLGLGALTTAIAVAQTFTPPAAATATITMPYSDLSQSQSLAVDSAGDIFFTRPGSGILAEKPAGGGAEITLYTTAAGGGGYPKGVAANDTYAYMTDYSGHLWQVPIGGGAATDIGSACGPLDGYYLGTQDVATDGLGNVYVAGNNETKLFKITSADVCTVVNGVTLDANSHVAADAVGDLAYSTGGVLYSLAASATTSVPVVATFNSIIGLRGDAAGNVFVTTYSGIVEVPFINGVLDGPLAFTVLSGSSQNDVAVSPDGTIYTTDGTNIFKNLIGNMRFPNTTVASTSTSQTVSVVFNSAETLSGIRYAAGDGNSTEIANTGKGTCAEGQAYAVGASCTIALTFTPGSIGARGGAVILSSATGVIGNVAVAGQGSGAGLVSDPGTQTTLGAAWQAPSGIAVSSTGDVFVTDKTAGSLSLIPAGSTTASVISGGLTQPTAVAVSASGNAYVTTATGSILAVPYTGTAYGLATTVATGLTAPSAIAYAPDGSLYIANTGAGTVVHIPNQGGALNFYDLELAGSGFKAPAGVAFDASGNLYVADSTIGSIFKVSGTSASSVASGLTSPTSIALDDSGALYVLEAGVPTALRIALTSSGYNTNNPTTLGTGFTSPAALAADSAGNLYLADPGTPSVTSIERTQGLLSLGKINVGSSSTAQSLIFSNDGDLSLTFGSPLYTASGQTGDYAISAPATSPCAAGAALASSASCGISGTFTPIQTGTRTDTLTIASNAVNAAGITGAFTGVGVNLPKTTLTLTTTPSGTVTYGTAVTAKAVVAAPAGSTIAPTGTVTFLVNGTAYKTVTLADATASVMITGLPAGPNTIDATYSGDDNYAASSGMTQTITVTLAPTTTTFTSSISSATPVPPGTAVTLTATVSSNVTTSSPTGTVNFESNGTTLASATVDSQTGIASVTTTTLPAGTYTIIAVYSGDSGFASSSSSGIQVAILAPQYDVVNSPTAITVAAPGSASATFTIAPISGYIGAVDYSCSGLPTNTQCIFLPATVQFNSLTPGPQNVTLTIVTDTAPPTTVAAWMLPFAGLLLFGAVRKRRIAGAGRLWLTLAFTLAFAAGLATLNGCGSGSSNSPAGNSTVTVSLIGSPNGTTTVPADGTGNIDKSFTFTLTVK